MGAVDDDGALLRRYLDGDAGAFEELMARHAPAIFGFLVLRVRDRQLAEDLLQDVFVRMLGAVQPRADGDAGPRYRHQDKLRAWLFRIARNLVIDHERRRAGVRLVPADAEAYPGRPGGPTLGETLPGPEWLRPEHVAEQRDMADAARAAIERLPTAQREGFLMRQAGLSFKDIALTQDCPVNTALGRMHDAVVALRRHLTERERAAS